MRRIVLGAEDGGIGDGRGAGVAGAAAGGVTLVLPESRGEYEEARAEVESLARAACGNEVTGPPDGGPDGMGGTYAVPGAGRWVVTTGEQRRTWDLPVSEMEIPVTERPRTTLGSRHYAAYNRRDFHPK